MSYEEDIKRMEEITQQLRDGQTPLATSVALFEEGITIAKRVEEELQKVEAKIEILVDSASGEETTEIQLEDFDLNPES